MVHKQLCQRLKETGLYTARGADELRLALLSAARESLREQGHTEEAITVEAARLALAHFGSADTNAVATAAAGMLAARKSRGRQR
ncbi:MAG TPA: hypothetical protein VMK12_02405 [Anaeromyxobacteraceae bacterium]|nr:hypothetical protein [Anaeromyxobacteraceae bacterium]